MPAQMTTEQIRKRMANVRREDTDIELALRSALHRRGHRFRKNVKSLPGSPDIVFPGKRLVVFVDGDFWHGWRFEERKDKLKPFWREKVERNIARDAQNATDLESLGWRVLRVWEHDVERRLASVVEGVEMVLAGGEVPARHMK